MTLGSMGGMSSITLLRIPFHYNPRFLFLGPVWFTFHYIITSWCVIGFLTCCTDCTLYKHLFTIKWYKYNGDQYSLSPPDLWEFLQEIEPWHTYDTMDIHVSDTKSDQIPLSGTGDWPVTENGRIIITKALSVDSSCFLSLEESLL